MIFVVFFYWANILVASNREGELLCVAFTSPCTTSPLEGQTWRALLLNEQCGAHQTGNILLTLHCAPY